MHIKHISLTTRKAPSSLIELTGWPCNIKFNRELNNVDIAENVQYIYQQGIEICYNKEDTWQWLVDLILFFFNLLFDLAHFKAALKQLL